MHPLPSRFTHEHIRNREKNDITPSPAFFSAHFCGRVVFSTSAGKVRPMGWHSTKGRNSNVGHVHIIHIYTHMYNVYMCMYVVAPSSVRNQKKTPPSLSVLADVLLPQETHHLLYEMVSVVGEEILRTV